MPLDVSLTNTNAVLGTPAYMSPEQMQGWTADSRSDQFSFCVALYEALYGTRPFEGSSMAALLLSMTYRRVRPAPKGSRVPARLRKVLLQGLAGDPADRWPSMAALLTEMQRLLAPRRRRGLVLGPTLGLAALGAALAVPQFLAMQERCSGARAQLVGTWDDARRQQVRDAVLGTEHSRAAATWERIEPQLDDYADAWTRKHTEVCEATVVRQEQTEGAMTLRMGCLRERLTALHAAVDVLAHADADATKHSVELVAGLPDLARCDDVERLEEQRQRVPPPDDPRVAEAVEQLRGRLADIDAMDGAGQHADALARAEAAVQQAEALGYAPVQAEAELRQGSLLERSGRYAEAERVLTQAHARAVVLGHDAVVLDAAQQLTLVVGDRLSRHAEGLMWGKTAVSLAEHAGDDTERAASLQNLAIVFARQGQHEQARLHYQRALQIRERALGADHPLVAHPLVAHPLVAHPPRGPS
ncbi:MAG: tetratricopeptide repeat protein, partial [Myxococcales bacterium]|nr:tetratricopeptide repeat protein [Myxococcales bacterium]